MKQIGKITISELKDIASEMYGDMVKADVDVAKRLIVINAELHADIEQFMLDNGSLQKDIWGINLYPDQFGSPDFIEYDSLINIRPGQGNRSRDVENAEVREIIARIVREAIVDD